MFNMRLDSVGKSRNRMKRLFNNEVTSRVNQSYKNMLTGIIMRIINLLLGFGSRTVFIYALGSVCLGINGLFTSIISMLSLADLGFAEAITFYLYKPIVDDDKERIVSLIRFYKIAYRIVGVVMFVIGMIVMPYIPHLIKLDSEFGYNIYLIYILYLLNVVITYCFFSYPQTFLTANQRQDIVNNISSVFLVLSFIGETVTLVCTHNFLYYMCVKVLINFVKNLVLFLATIKKYKFLIRLKAKKIDKNEFKIMFSDLYSIFIVKVASQLFTATDNIFISFFLGTVLVGINSNYVMITGALTTLVGTVTNALSGSVGNYCAQKSKSKIENLFETIDFGMFIIAFISTVCMFNLFNDFIKLAWGEEYILDGISVLLICSNYYIPVSLYSLFCFRQSMGLFKAYRYNQLLAAIINIILDFLLVKRIGIIGVFLATTIANLLFAVFPFIKNLYIEGFEKTSLKACITWGMRYALTICCALLIKVELSEFRISWLNWSIKALIIIIECLSLIVILTRKSSEYKNLKQYVINSLKKE